MKRGLICIVLFVVFVLPVVAFAEGESSSAAQEHLKAALVLCDESANFTSIEKEIEARKSDSATNSEKLEYFCLISDQGRLAVSTKDKLECLDCVLKAAEGKFPVAAFARTWIEFRKKLYREKTPEQVTEGVIQFIKHKPGGIDNDDRRFIFRALTSGYVDKNKPEEVVRMLTSSEDSGEGSIALLNLLDAVEKDIARPKKLQSSSAPKVPAEPIKPPAPPPN